MKIDNKKRKVAIVSGLRTPFTKAGTLFKGLTALDLGKIVTVELINRAEIDPEEIDEVIFGTVIPAVKTSNLAREIALGSGIPPHAPALTVTSACASSNQAIINAAEGIMLGRSDAAVAGGTESISNFPVLFSEEMRRTFQKSRKAENLYGKISPYLNLSLSDLIPDVPEIAERSTGLTMGESAEKMAKENRISREDQDIFALRSHRLSREATEDGRLAGEIAPVFIPPDFSTVADFDTGIRGNTTIESLTEVEPAFDRKYGTVTAGNSASLSDGASAVLLMAEEKAKFLGYDPLGYIRSYGFSALPPGGQLLMGPAYSTPLALDRAGVRLKDIDLIEIHEAFAAQVLSNIRSLSSNTFAEEKLGRKGAVGEVDMEKLNVNGGSIAIGHPFGATGGRLVITLLRELRRMDGNLGLVALCAAGGLGISMVLERK